MDLFEYQGKQYFARYDIPVSAGDVALTVDEAVSAAEAAGYPVVVKAQVQVGGRGKAGGIKLAADADEVRLHAGNILGMDIKGHVVERLWVENASDIDEEYYASFTLDRGAKKHLLMLSAQGGVEIEAVAIIGAGFGGLGMAHYLKLAGFEYLTIFEKKGALGGVWRDNTYPGAACDVPSHLSSFSFETGYPWSHRFARQPEILAYQQHCAERHDLLRHIRFGHELTAARFDPARAIWTLSFAGGDTLEADIVVSAVGQLHRPSIPDIPGAEGFAGLRFHSAQWPASLDLSGKRVAVVGTGASAVQFVPEIAPQVDTLHVFQRSPGWVLPMEWVSPGAAVPYSPLSRTLFKAIPMLEALDRAAIDPQVGGILLAKTHEQRAGTGKPHPVAVFAEIVRHRGDETDASAGFLYFSRA